MAGGSGVILAGSAEFTSVSVAPTAFAAVGLVITYVTVQTVISHPSQHLSLRTREKLEGFATGEC